MKLRELLQQMQQVQRDIGSSPFFVCGGAPRDKFMGRLDNVADIDITTGDKTVDYLSQQFYEDLRKQYNVTRKTMEDGHSTIFLGSLKIDFSSNFVVHNIDFYLRQMGIDQPTNMRREMFSRDFTCNTLLLTPDLKKLLDPTKRGFQDIKAQVIRTCLSPEVTLTSNRNRVVRAIYLACKLDFQVDPAIVEFVKKNPQTIKISTDKSLKEKLNQAFSKNPEKASDLISQMGLWSYIPITPKIYPYYMKTKSMDKKAYFQGGGGVNEPTPHTKKYESDPAIVVQPHFIEPFYRNYDLYTIPGMEHIGPGTGYHGLQSYKSVSEFLKARRERLKPRYTADDSWQLDDGSRVKKNPDRKARMVMLAKIVKQAENGCQISDMEYDEGRDAYHCKKCDHLGFNGPYESKPTVSQLHSGKDYTQSHDDNDSPNFDYGDGAYDAMSKGKKMKTITDAPHKSPGAFFADDNEDHMMPPKEHGTKIYDWKNSPYQGKPKAPKRHDSNNIDFPIDDQINSSPIVGNSGSSYVDSIPISYMEDYTQLPDQDGKPESTLDFGYDLTDEEPNRNVEESDLDLDQLEQKYLITPAEAEIYGLPDGIEPEAKDADQTIQTENPYTGISDIGRQMYEDKWNI